MYRFFNGFFSFSSCCIVDRLAVHCESGCLYQFTLLFVKTWFFSVINCYVIPCSLTESSLVEQVAAVTVE